jgi:hypothetical protein
MRSILATMMSSRVTVALLRNEAVAFEAAENAMRLPGDRLI